MAAGRPPLPIRWCRNNFGVRRLVAVCKSAARTAHSNRRSPSSPKRGLRSTPPVHLLHRELPLKLSLVVKPLSGKPIPSQVGNGLRPCSAAVRGQPCRGSVHVAGTAHHL